MRARVRVEALEGRELEGHVTEVSALPTQVWYNDVRFFIATVKLDTIPKGLLPGMTAEVEIVTAQRPDALVIPAEALASEDGRDVCYVALDDHLERRELKIGQSTRLLHEVTEGLDEGEEVVLDPTHIGTSVEVVNAPEESPRGEAVTE
jgi:HlyD family secretion protein